MRLPRTADTHNAFYVNGAGALRLTSLAAAQHDGSAEMVVDGVSLYRSEAAAGAPAGGFKQFCTPAPLAPSWHDLALRYASAPGGARSVLRFFVVDCCRFRNAFGCAPPVAASLPQAAPVPAPLCGPLRPLLWPG